MKLLQDIIPTLWDRNFQPLSGGSVEVYTDPNIPVFAKLYSSPGSRDAELPNPLPLNSAGRFSSGGGADTPVYFDDKGVHVVVKDRNGVKAKEFTFPDFGLDGAVTEEAASIDELKEIEGYEGLHVLVLSPAPFRWYEWVDSSGTNDGVFNIPAKDGRGYWRLVLQSNWAYSSWWELGDLNELLDYLIPSMPGLDLCVNSKLAGTGGNFDFLGKLKLTEGAKIQPDGKTVVYCHGGFEASKTASANGKTVFHVYGGVYSTENLNSIALSGFVNNLHLNSDWSIPAGAHLEVFTLSGRAGCTLTAYGGLYLTETSDEIAQFKINPLGQGFVQLNGPAIAANAFSDKKDWRFFKDNNITSGGLFFHDGIEYIWNYAPDAILHTLSGHMKFSGSEFPKFANAHREARITNNGSAYYPIPKGMRLENLKGKFDPSGGWFANEAINSETELNPGMDECVFINCTFDTSFAASKRCKFANCVFKKEIEITSDSDYHSQCVFTNCVFYQDIKLSSARYKSLAITNCTFEDEAKIDGEFPFPNLLSGNISGNIGGLRPVNVARPNNQSISKVGDSISDNVFSIKTDLVTARGDFAIQLFKEGKLLKGVSANFAQGDSDYRYAFEKDDETGSFNIKVTIFENNFTLVRSFRLLFIPVSESHSFELLG